MGDAADGPSRKIKVLRRNGMGVGMAGIGGNISKYCKYWVGGWFWRSFGIRSAIFFMTLSCRRVSKVRVYYR